jgi:hypothetical protein
LFLYFFVIKTLDLDLEPDSLEMLDPDPMNLETDGKPTNTEKMYLMPA